MTIVAHFRAALVLVAVVSTAAGAEGWVSDGWITSEVKIALFTTQGLTATDVSVDTLDGRVSLYGKVPTNADKQRAEDEAKQVKGVTSVRNILQVVPPERGAIVEANDATLRAALEAAL